MHKTLVPQLRFPDFKGDWDIKKLEEMGTVSIGLTYSPQDISDVGILVLRSSNVKNGIIDLYDQVKVITQIPDKLFTKQDDILICVRNGSQGLIGKCAIISNEHVGMTFGAFMSIFRSNANKFVFQLFQTKRYKSQIQENLGARINQITNKNINEFKFLFPSLPEQTKIANFLTAIDDKIQQLTQKKQLLEQYKKGVMQQIFSYKIRFQDDNGNDYPEWEEKKLGEIIEHFGGTSLEEFSNLSGNYKFISIGNYSTDGQYIDNLQRIDGNNKSLTKLLNIDDLVMVLNDKTHSGDIIGSTILIDKA